MSIAPEDVNEIIITDETTLLRYTEPFELVENEKSTAAESQKKSHGLKGPQKSEKCSAVQEILDMISPPLEFEEDGKKWKQQVSMEPVTRSDVHKLGENLNIRLRTRQARSAGICSVRLDLFSQLFDELIRHVTLNSGERGLLLLRIRDELRMTLATHAALYEGSVAFGSKKASEAEEGQEEFMDEISGLNEDINKIKKDIRNLKFKYQMMEIRAEEIKVAQQKKHKDEIAFLNKTNQQLKAQLESIIAPKK
ncbi:Dynein, axonemal, light intermediate chain 1 [Nesidiocoris tenuis]|uniref:Dynein, axonemal, light intermediate chain 1 n=1 Tax=Nesidiocoris tenuis TaxID=355587 RepID=A0ABN7AL03_9HEMI|nr:Dynein, axonemal, light intermediate chain 1 [Nesidiocoris tenuis]